MSTRHSPGNINATNLYDPFPKTGLAAQYKGFIINFAVEIAGKYPGSNLRQVISDAVRLALEAERRFKPELGNDFSTFCRHHLKGLRRLIERDQEIIKVPEPTKEERETAKALEAREAAERAEERKKRPVFRGGANGVRLTFDRQWNSLGSFNSRHRAVIGVQLRGGDEIYSRGIVERISEFLAKFLANRPLESIRPGFLRAVVDSAECSQREADQEAENRKRSDYKPVFLDPQRHQIDIRFYPGREPPDLREWPSGIIYVSWTDAAGNDENGDPLKLQDVIGAWPSYASPLPTCDSDVDRLVAAINAERPFLSPKERQVLDWKLDPHAGKLVDLASRMNVSKGYVSKLDQRVGTKLARRMKD